MMAFYEEAITSVEVHGLWLAELRRRRTRAWEFARLAAEGNVDDFLEALGELSYEADGRQAAMRTVA